MNTDIDRYLSALPRPQRDALQRLRRLLHAEIPGAEETIKTRVPALRYKGKTVVGLGAAARHVALYVMFGDGLRTLKVELAGIDDARRRRHSRSATAGSMRAARQAGSAQATLAISATSNTTVP